MDIIKKITKKQINPNIPEFRVGDTLRVDVRIIEGNKERIQAFEGVCTERKGSGVSETFTVRKGKVRRAKLRFLRDKIANYRIKERNKK